MKRRIHLQGELKDLYVDSIVSESSSVQEVVKLLEANFPSMRKYFIDCHEKGVGFEIIDGNKVLEENQELTNPLEGEDLYITAVPAGAKYFKKIFGAILLVILAFSPLGPIAFLGTTVGSLAMSLAINLAVSAISDLLAPDPATDKSAPAAYLFSGSEQNIVEGDPVPILYGQLEIPGRPISFSVTNSSASQSTSRDFSTSIINADGSIEIVGQ